MVSSVASVAEVPSSSLLELRHASTARAIFVTVPLRRFMACDGIGQAGSAEFLLATRAILAAHAALLSDLRRRRLPVPIRPMVTECLWEPSLDRDAFDLASALADPARWRWRQMIEVPDSATEDLALAAIDDARRGFGRTRALTRFATYLEGSVGQILHLGGRPGLGETVVRLGDEIVNAGYSASWPLHELILADPRAVPEGRGRMIVRLPIASPASLRDREGTNGLHEAGRPRMHPWRMHDAIPASNR